MLLQTSSVPKCASCAIPLPSYCARNKLSSKVNSSLENVSFIDAIEEVFKCKKSAISFVHASLKDEELCRYCSLNLIRLLKCYRTFTKVTNEAGSVLWKIVGGNQARNLAADDLPLHEGDVETNISEDNFMVEGSDYEELPPGLTYLGLVRKKPRQTTTEDEQQHAEDNKNADEIRTDLSISELGMTDSRSQALESRSPSTPSRLTKTTNNSFRCGYCSKSFSHRQRLHRHMKTHHESSSNQVEEDRSPIKEQSAVVQARTLRNQNGQRAKRVVKETRAKIATKATPAEINKGSSSGRKSKKNECICKICKKEFKHVQFLNQHMQVHSNDKRCPECEKKFKSAALLKRHMQIHEKDTSSFKCDDCGREFPNLLGLQVHAVTHTRTLYTCKGCKRKFKIEKNFVQHLETARCTEKKHPCPNCGKLFKNKDKVKRHLISMHSETKPFTCNSCGKGFRSQADLNFHEVNAHICGETKQFQCEQCGKRFKSLETLKSHEMYSHKMEKKHFCQTCGKGFPLLATLKIHEISHSDNRPFMCTYCGRTYKHANDLKSHEVVHYKDEEKPFACPICGLRYHRKDVLRLHQAREKHFGPDVPLVGPVKRHQSDPTKSSKRNNNNNSPLVFKLEDLIEDEPVHSNDSSSVLSSPPLVTVATQAATNNISVIQTVNSTNFATHQPILQATQNLANATTTHIVPILQTSALTLQQQQHPNTITAPTFNVTVTPVNEAITDFYRIMYDLA